LLDVAENMVSRGGNPNVSGNDEVLLCVVCEKQNMRLVEAFLKAGADPTVDTDSKVTDVK